MNKELDKAYWEDNESAISIIKRFKIDTIPSQINKFVSNKEISLCCDKCNKPMVIVLQSRSAWNRWLKNRTPPKPINSGSGGQVICDDCGKEYALQRNKENYTRKNGSIVYKKYLLSSKWAKTRKAAYKRADYRCQRCGHSRKLYCHHLHYKNLGNERPEDLVVFCKECHEKEHSTKSYEIIGS